jgi:peptidoglycan/LPS O-acetylase OafA/YrhL
MTEVLIGELDCMKHTYTERITELDGIRGFCTLLVVVSHYVHLVALDSANPTIRSLAAPLNALMGVMDVFFALSGFLIGGILIDVRDSPQYFKTFYIRRVYRIFPLYYLIFGAFLATRIIGWLLDARALEWLIRLPIGQLGRQDVLWTASYAVYAQNAAMAYAGDYGPYWMAPTWSLAVEEQFYLTLPLLIWLIPPRWLARVALACVLAAPVMRFAAATAFPRSTFVLQYVLTPFRFDSLGIGVLTAVLYRNPAAWARVVRAKPVIYAVMGVSFAVVGAVYAKALTFDFSKGVGYAVFFFSQAVAYACVLWVALAFKESALARFWRIRSFCKVGEFSYGLYLVHVPLLGLAHAILWNAAPRIDTPLTALTTVAAFALSVLTARALWRYVEKPLLKRGQSFRY